MPADWLDVNKVRRDFADFVNANKSELQRFGNTVNQVFEAYVFASVASHYRKRGWTVTIRPPTKGPAPKDGLRLKFNTNGEPANYSFFECVKGKRTVHIRHQLRVQTHHHADQRHEANVCLDVAVIKPTEVLGYTSKKGLPNNRLVTFGEAKHMAAFAELVAGFVGLVHEMQPKRLEPKKRHVQTHPYPFLFVSGHLNGTALGLRETLEARRLAVRVYARRELLPGSLDLHTHPAPARPAPNRARAASRGLRS